MKSSIIGKLFILLTVFLISIMAVSAADYTLSVYNLNLEVGANDANVHTDDENNVYCKFKISTGSDLVAKGGSVDVKITWTVGSFELEPVTLHPENVKNIATLSFKGYLKSSQNWAQSGINFKVDDSLKCVASVHWENPNKQGDEPATVDSNPQEKSTVVSNTKPSLNFGSEDDFPTVTEGAVTEGKWEGTGPVKNKVSDIDTSSGQTLSFSATSSHPSDFTCSVNELELSYKLTNTNFNTDGKTAYCEVKANDGKDPSNTDQVYLHINDDNTDEIAITSAAVSTATVDVNYEYKVTVTNPDELTLMPTFEVKPDWLNAGVKDKTTTGFTIYGKPTKEGTDAVVLVVKAGAQEKKQEYGIVVSNPSEPSLTVADQIIKFGNKLTFNLDSYLSNPSKLKVTYSIDSKPQGLIMYTMNSNNVNNYVELTPTEAQKGTYSLTVKATYTISGVQKEKTDIFNINVKGTSCLVINDIDVSKGEDGSDHDSGVDKNGGTVDEVEGGDKLKVDIELKNTCIEETNNKHEVEQIEATIKLPEMADDGDDQDEDVNFDDLKVGKSDSQIVTFSVPIDADEGSYEMTIEAKGYDKESNDLYEIDPVKIVVKVEKPNDKLKFKTFSLNPSTISCTKKTQLTLKLLNTGSSDEDVQLVLSSSELNIEEIELFELEEGDADDDDTMYTKTYTFDVPSNAATGTYVITGKAYYNSGDDEEVETGSAILTVAGCGTTSTSTSGSTQKTYDSGADETSEEVEVVSTPAPITTTTTTQTVTAEPPATTATTIGGEEESFFESSLYIGLLVAGIIVVLLVIIVLIVAVSRR